MPDPTITDRDHLSKIATSIARQIAQLTHHWLDEDQGSTTRRTGGPSGSGPGDPTATIATTPDRTRDRDRIGRTLLRIHKQLGTRLAELTPRHPNGRCRCCHRADATHGMDDHGKPRECWACWAYVRRMGYRCNDEIHEGRPRVRMCECPPECCQVCPDRVAERRSSLSDRCAQRKARGLWERTA